MSKSQSEELTSPTMNGWLALVFFLFLLGFFALQTLSTLSSPSFGSGLISFCLLIVLCIFLGGFFILQPNQGVAFTFFGSYAGSFKEEGFWFTNPFYVGQRISLKTNNHASDLIKVNDSKGNPVEIVAVISYRVENTRLAVFGVEDYEAYLATQSEAALRQIASQHPYETDQDKTLSLRSDLEEIADLLRDIVQKQCALAGLYILDARISHLSYAPEVAQLMLRKQQAEAVVQAREKLVQGAVGMIENAIAELYKREIVNLTDTQKAQLVINMMTVLLSESGAQPVVSLTDKS